MTAQLEQSTPFYNGDFDGDFTARYNALQSNVNALINNQNVSPCWISACADNTIELAQGLYGPDVIGFADQQVYARTKVSLDDILTPGFLMAQGVAKEDVDTKNLVENTQAYFTDFQKQFPA